ncbi:hypothetical protein NTE_01389 [Candidatus Nitrososphaera evergladensis SR1]|jgi:hypothetical protein|uniref:Uncharacterized protein n=1 Tax=Candidatus Nitrososphaera evergladensis SR1 TaxID=1459636 RepID=A0A075MPH4_9ARCH|nr:hypothetical protein [Candidatus Nitrososphaera evergladensis]AIF83456.1 hypothetical protein NTE_01389 [Candidatus Nitrososphaera evergladensis SR1]
MQEDMWLEVRACQGTPAAKDLEHETVLRIPALSEALKAVEKASLDMARKGGSTMWDYSRKLEPGEADDVRGLFAGAQEKDDGRSRSLSTDYSYYGRCYTLTLFTFK